MENDGDLVEKITFELPIATTRRLRQARLDLRSARLPVTQQMIVQALIDDADIDVLAERFAKSLERRIGHASRASAKRIASDDAGSARG